MVITAQKMRDNTNSVRTCKDVLEHLEEQIVNASLKGYFTFSCWLNGQKKEYYEEIKTYFGQKGFIVYKKSNYPQSDMLHINWR